MVGGGQDGAGQGRRHFRPWEKTFAKDTRQEKVGTFNLALTVQLRAKQRVARSRKGSNYKRDEQIQNPFWT